MTSSHGEWEERYRRSSCEPPEEPSSYLADRLPEPPGGRALDAATGAGRNARLLADRGYTVDAVDIARAALRRAVERTSETELAGTVNWIQADLSALPLEREVYDVVAVSFFYGPSVVLRLVSSLAPGGTLVYEHHVCSDTSDLRGPSDRYRYRRNELLELCRGLDVLDYREFERVEDDGRVSSIVQVTVRRGDD